MKRTISNLVTRINALKKGMCYHRINAIKNVLHCSLAVEQFAVVQFDLSIELYPYLRPPAYVCRQGYKRTHHLECCWQLLP